MKNSWSYAGAGEIVFGRGSVSRVGRIARKLKAKRALVIADAGVVAAGLLERVSDPLKAEDVDVVIFDRGMPEPEIQTAEDCIAFARKTAPDLLVGLGGGSNNDVAKATAAILTYGGTPRDYFGEGKVPGPVLPVVAVSTTSGTGSEVSPAAVFTDKQANLKIGMSDNYLRPRVAIFDPELTVSLPPSATAATGIDALCHAIEAFTAIDYHYFPAAEETTIYHGKNPLTDCLAAKAIELVAGNLRLAVYQGGNLEARENMALASLLAGLAFTNAGLAAVHALAFPIGALTHAAHGVVCGLVLPYVMELNLPARPVEYAQVAALLGENIDGLSSFEAARLGVEAVKSLESDIGLPLRLSDYGVKENDVAGLAEATMGVTRMLRGNPRRVVVEDMERVLRKAL